MNEQGIFNEVFKYFGLPGVIILYLMWDRWQDRNTEKELEDERKKRKASGDWISGQDFKRVSDDLTALTVKMNGHLEKEALEDVKLAKMESEQDHFKENIVEIKENQKETFRLISEIKTMLVESHK